MNRVKHWVGLNHYLEEDEDIFEEMYREESETYPPGVTQEMEPEKTKKTNRNITVLNHPAATAAYEVLVVEPRAFDESLDLVDALRDRKTLVLNLHLLDSEQSQRVVDFLSGATHALDGHQQRIGDGVFIFTPSNVTVSAESDKSRSIADSFWQNHPQ